MLLVASRSPASQGEKDTSTSNYCLTVAEANVAPSHKLVLARTSNDTTDSAGESIDSLHRLPAPDLECERSKCGRRSNCTETAPRTACSGASSVSGTVFVVVVVVVVATITKE